MTTTSPLQGKFLIPFIAPPNGGKGTQTKRLRQKHDLPTFDMGATFRSILKEGKNPQLADEIKKYMNEGKLVPLEIVMKVFTAGFEELAQKNPNAKGFILDGFPRDLGQAQSLMALCKKWGAEIAKVVYLNVSNTTVEKRATGRRFCSKDATHVYNLNDPDFQPKDANKCDIDGEPLIIRDDDKPETVQKRLKEYAEQTNPIIDMFKKSGDLAEIDGERDADDVEVDVENALKDYLKSPVAG